MLKGLRPLRVASYFVLSHRAVRRPAEEPMPTYEYVCRDCGQHLEVVQSFRDASLTICPACQGSLRKVYGAAGIIFKGSGYYVNDSRKPPPESTSGSSKDDSASKPAKKETSSDTAASSEAKSA